MCDAVGTGFVRDDRVRLDNPLGYADAIKAHLENHTGGLARYEAALVNCFGAAPRIQPFHEDMVSLPFRGFLTTNYERTLETALALIESEPSEKSVVIGVEHSSLAHAFIKSLASTSSGRLVAHIHGWYKQPSSIILSASDYARAYGTNRKKEDDLPLLLDFLKIAVAPVSLVFVGFSFNDQHFGNFLAAAGSLFKLWGTDAHYALVPTTKETVDRDLERAAEYKERFAVETVFYERIGASHQQLFDMIASFREQIGLTKRRSAVVDFNDRMVEGMRG